jgi:hypothetical protein
LGNDRNLPQCSICKEPSNIPGLVLPSDQKLILGLLDTTSSKYRAWQANFLFLYEYIHIKKEFFRA